MADEQEEFDSMRIVHKRTGDPVYAVDGAQGTLRVQPIDDCAHPKINDEGICLFCGQKQKEDES